MGSFLTNVQVFVGEQSAGEVRDALVRWLPTALKGEGMYLTRGADAPERTIVFGPVSDDRRWVSVFDEAGEDQSGSHQELARAASAVLKTFALSVLVHDSDVLEVHLFHGGRELDAYCNRPDYFEGGTAGPSGDASRWAPVLGPGRTESDLEQAFHGAAHDADAVLVQIARVLGIDADLATAGFNSLDEARSSDDLLRLGFTAEETSTGRQAREQELESDRERPHQGSEPPELVPAKEGHTPTFVIGTDPNSTLEYTLQVKNIGGRTEGVVVNLSGVALDRGLLEVSRVRVVSGAHAGEVVPEPDTSGPRKTALALLEELPIGASLTVTLFCRVLAQSESSVVLNVSVMPIQDVRAGCRIPVLLSPDATGRPAP